MKTKVNRIVNFSSIRQKLGILIVLMLSMGALQAEHACFLDEDSATLQSLNDFKFQKLKSDVAEYLKNSWCSSDKSDLIMDLILLTRPAVCVEIGAFIGSTVLPVAATLKHLGCGKVIAIDAWSNTVATQYLEDEDVNKSWWSIVNMEHVYQAFGSMLNKWTIREYCSIVRKSSAEAVAQIGNIDFLHLDGDYSEYVSMQDVNSYLPKVHQGGYILMSNILVAANGRLPKMEAFSLLYEQCEMVCEIERGNSILFRKM